MICGQKLNIHYENGMILRADALNMQSEEMLSVRKQIYSDYPDGIISGFELCKKSDEGYFFREGLAKLNGEIFVLNTVSENDIQNITAIDGTAIRVDHIYYLCIVKTPSDQDNDSDCEDSPIAKEYIELAALTKSEVECNDVVIVARFKKSASKIIFAETLEEYKSNCFSTLYGDYSIAGDKAVSSVFTAMIGDEIEKKQSKDYLDVSLYMLCVQNNLLSRKALIFYCSCKLNKPVAWEEILDSLCDSLKITLNQANAIQMKIEEPSSNNKDDFNYYK